MKGSSISPEQQTTLPLTQTGSDEGIEHTAVNGLATIPVISTEVA